jgi:hypothetical protein
MVAGAGERGLTAAPVSRPDNRPRGTADRVSCCGAKTTAGGEHRSCIVIINSSVIAGERDERFSFEGLRDHNRLIASPPFELSAERASAPSQ